MKKSQPIVRTQFNPTRFIGLCYLGMCSVFASLLVLPSVAVAELPLEEYHDLMRCYDPGMIVTKPDVVKSRCTARIAKLSQETQDTKRLIALTDIVATVDSPSAARPILDRALSTGRIETCGNMSMQRLLVVLFDKGQRAPILKCRPLNPNHLQNFFLHAPDPSSRNRLCSEFKTEIAKFKMKAACSPND